MIFNSVVPIVKNVIENVTDLFDLNLETISGSIESTSIQGSGSTDSGNISVVDNDTSLYDIFDTNLEFGEIKSNGDFVLSGFTDDVIFYDSTKDRITMDNELKLLQVTFPSGYIQSLKYNKVIKYDSKTVTLYNWEDGFTFPLIDYVDDGSQVTLKMYAIYSENKACEMVLLDRNMATADLPTDYESFLYIKDITIPAHELFQKSQNSIPDYENPNYNVLGSMTITDGIASGFSTSNYIDTKESIPMSSASSMEIFIKMNIPSAYNNYAIIGNSTDSGAAGGFVLRTTGSTRVYFWSTSNKSNWNISSSFDTWIDLQDGTNYIKIVFNGSRYTFYHSTDNVTWSEGNGFDNSTPLADFYPRFGMAGSSNIPLPGSIDFNETYFKINNEIVWKAYNQTYKWYCKTLHYDTSYTDEVPVNIWFNKTYYTTGGKYIESRNAYIIDCETDPSGCLLDYADDGFGNLALNLYAVEFDNSGEYKLLLSDKNTSVLENYGDITDIELISTNIVLQSHFNSEYIDEGEYELKDQFQSFSYEDETTEPSRFIVLENENLGLVGSSASPTNFEIQGNVTITDGIAEGFTSSDYLYTSDFNFADATSTYEVVFKVLFTGDGDGCIWTQPVGNSYFGTLVFSHRDGGYCLSGNDWDYRDLSWDGSWLEQNQWGYIKYTKDGSIYSLYTSLDNENWTYRSSFEWGNAIQNDGHAFTIGYSVNRGGPFPGKIDLNECYVKFGDEIVWTPYSNGNKVFENTELAPYTRELIPYDAENFNKIGNPTIENEIVTGFNSSNYLTLPELFLPGNNTWEMVFKVNSRTTSYSQLVGSEDDGNGIGIFINGGRFFVSAGIGGWYYDTGLDNGVVANTDYWVKFEYTGTQYILSSSTDGIHYNDSKAVSNSNTLNSTNVVKIGYGSRMGASWNGTIDLSESYIKVDGSYWWRPYTQEYEYNYRGSLVNYTDDGSANTIKAYKIHYTTDDTRIILTNDTTYTDQDIDSKTYLADIVIPEHGVYTYGAKQIVENYENEKLTGSGTMGGSSPACEADSYYDSSYYPYRAFDKSDNQWLSADIAGSHWITYYTPTAIRLDKIDIKNYSDGNYTTFQYKVLVSNDNTTWTEIKSGVNLNNVGSDVWSISDFTNNNTDVKYIRILSTKGFNPTRVGFKEIYIYGHTTTSGYGWIPSNQ